MRCECKRLASYVSAGRREFDSVTTYGRITSVKLNRQLEMIDEDVDFHTVGRSSVEWKGICSVC